MKVNFAFHLEIKVPEFGERVERHRIHVAWSPVWSFHSQWWFGLPCHLLVLIHCVFWSPQSTQISTRKFWSTSCFLLLTSFMEMLISFSSSTFPHFQRYQKLVQWPWCYCAWLASKLTWPDPIENLWGIVKRKMRDTRPKNADDLLSKQPGLPLHPSSATGWSPPCHAALMQ